MTITINYRQKVSPGYTPRKSVTIYNVNKVIDAGPRMVKVAFIFRDDVITHDHVASVNIKPDTEYLPEED